MPNGCRWDEQREKYFERLRAHMVQTQLRARGIKDERVLKAFMEVPRHRFVLPENIKEAHEDHPLPIGFGQTISQPFMVATMTEALSLRGDEKALEVGAGSGYQAAILGKLCKEVYAIERIPELAERAKRTIEELGYTNVHIVVGDGTLGLPEHAPYDAIVVSAAAPDIPPALIEQLSDGGRLVIPVGSQYSQVLIRVTKSGGRIKREEICACVFVPLIGKYGWQEDVAW
ncbi:MAG: protein-L-isoaspartate(D-aspartate) O-methyltransferase [Armatimonadota bacterium]|nr:protein-L-isoaspartate(D-aspartate) O-methyltransferase [Armatimonadota bacterium]MCX7777469.1 protein-L-isoaspartate(D-aspartate) O-methyltransferase [Armatimonadota bacterium]MDW8025522.1 protein-L-isoaspartate(D-aspartate) O-methyltransferase [Armatimonadota bacterium]